MSRLEKSSSLCVNLKHGFERILLASAIFAISFPAFIAEGKKIEVSNRSSMPSRGEIVEVPAAEIPYPAGEFIIRDAKGREVGYQLTHDNLLIFPVSVPAKTKVYYTIESGTPAPVDTIAYGRFVPERLDDMTWENDRAAYRAYGPALQMSGQRAYGYDIWSKSVSYPVIDRRYYNHLRRNISFHEDHGNGLDDYAVGPTLGAGTDALIRKDGTLLMPYCWDKYEILDCGPLRFSVKLTYLPTEFEGNTVTETRVITLDKGSFLNKTDISFDGLENVARLAQGIVVHTDNPEGYRLSSKDKYVAVEDLNEHPDRGNGKVYVGIVSPDSREFTFIPAEPETHGVCGHAAAIAEITPDRNFTYYWGSGWSKGFMPGFNSWNAYLKNFDYRLRHPLKVKVTD